MIKEKILLKLITFRNMGVRGEWETFVPPESSYMEELAALARQHGFANVTIV